MTKWLLIVTVVMSRNHRQWGLLALGTTCRAWLDMLHKFTYIVVAGTNLDWNSFDLKQFTFSTELWWKILGWLSGLHFLVMGSSLGRSSNKKVFCWIPTYIRISECGCIFPYSNAGACFEPTSVALHQTETFEGRSTEWASNVKLTKRRFGWKD